MSSLYGIKEPVGADTKDISTAFVICTNTSDFVDETIYSHLPSFDEHAHAGTKENHPAGVLVVVDEV